MDEKKRPRSTFAVKCITAFGFMFLYIPIVFVIFYSFFVPEQGPGTPLHFTLDWYRKVFTNPTLMTALEVSLQVSMISTLISTFLGTVLALSFERLRFPGKKIFHGLIVAPLVMPEIVLGLALLIWFVLLKLSLGTFSIVLAHVTFCLSYVVMTVRARLAEFDESLEEAAQDLGATPVQTFWKVTFPLIFPGILSGALMAFTLSFDDFLITFFTAGVGSDTLPLKLYSMIKFGVSPEVNALSTLLFGSTLLLVLFFRPLILRRHAT